ncbi:early boundary activity protein 1 [Drosophila sechellia]|uniref:GD22697 n=3 Tax=melanogaster subgroup TaxID=32351 RepID=B4Q316_DROSI|nr:early boundary activity protein 1 [Drosophila sechellia]XP_002078147.3 early boundary activity protein 1 [Drosophila simulans]EDW54260.1 GM18079 [Drosophila sechellia]EDX03732.1 GD22697 [Drosophila simulans]
MINRRQRLEFALTLLPYDPETVQLSETQKKVEAIIARLRTDDSLTEEESDDCKVRRIQEANEFADSAMRHIEMSDSGKLSTLETLTLAAERLLRTQRPPDQDFDDMVQDMEDSQLMRNTIQAVNEARLKLLQQWERSKRKALDLLTIEIEKVQEMDQEQEHKQAHEQDQDQEQSSEPFDVFRDGADDHNTSTPKTNDEDLGLDDDDEDYVPGGEETIGNKRKRIKKPVTSTPNAKRRCPGFEFDLDGESPMVMIGPNGTEVSRISLSAINWDMTGPSITRKLLCEIFDRDTLAHHTLSGKPSPAFRDCARPSKQQLDPLKVADLVYLMTNSLDMTPREVRTAITTKCADENKMLRSRMQRKSK